MTLLEEIQQQIKGYLRVQVNVIDKPPITVNNAFSVRVITQNIWFATMIGSLVFDKIKVTLFQTEFATPLLSGLPQSKVDQVVQTPPKNTITEVAVFGLKATAAASQSDVIATIGVSAEFSFSCKQRINSNWMEAQYKVDPT